MPELPAWKPLIDLALLAEQLPPVEQGWQIRQGILAEQLPPVAQVPQSGLTVHLGLQEFVQQEFVQQESGLQVLPHPAQLQQANHPRREPD